MSIPKIMTALLLSLCLLTVLTGCDAWEDAVELFESLGQEETAETEELSEEASLPEEEFPEDSSVTDALGIVVSGSFSTVPDRSVSGWLQEYYPGGDWTCTADTVDYWATVDDYHDGPTELHFGFLVDSEKGTFTLECCTFGEYTYTEEDIPTLPEHWHP